MTARLYTIPLSYPGHAARLMLEHKGIPHRISTLPAGLHPVLLRASGFRGYTVPALKIEGRRIEGSLAIAQELERLQPEPGLYPAGPSARRDVEEAERWAEAELQPLARRMLRWAMTEQMEPRRWIAELSKLPAPAIQARTTGPLVKRFAKASGATSDRIRQDLSALPALLDNADELVAAGVLAADNAAGIQAGTSIWALGMFEQLDSLLAGRASTALAHTVLADCPRAPVELPADWLPAR